MRARWLCCVHTYTRYIKSRGAHTPPHTNTYLRESPEQLEHALLEAGAILGLLLFHEVGDDALALAQVGHGEGANLVHAHHLRHGWEDNNRIHLVTKRLNRLDNLMMCTGVCMCVCVIVHVRVVL